MGLALVINVRVILFHVKSRHVANGLLIANIYADTIESIQSY